MRWSLCRVRRFRARYWLPRHGSDFLILPTRKVQNLQLMDDILIIDSSVEQLIVQREQQRIIARILEQLKPLDWKIFVAYYYQYKKVNEIAQELQMNPQTVKTRLRRGREVLKKFLIKEGYESNAD